MSGTILIGFEQLTRAQADTLLDYATKSGILASEGERKASGGGKAGGTPSATPAPAGVPDEITLPKLNTVAREYATRFTKDARKAVCNHFGATTVGGANGIPEENWPEAYELFTAADEFMPSGVESDEASGATADLLESFQDGGEDDDEAAKKAAKKARKAAKKAEKAKGK